MREYLNRWNESRSWIDAAIAAGWLEAAAAQRFQTLERGVPADLFADGDARPLVVALFGGTGVGKSTLLNRLAGADLARTGVERPTSREVTLYRHRGVRLADLPADLVHSVRIVDHDNSSRRGVLWIDAPDIDSTEERNRRLSLAWLPHVDLVIYVVSPERYRDDVGWRVLQQRGQRHGWMFVINRWDEGDPRQADDFAFILRRAGFENPWIFRTSCAPRPGALPSADQFPSIEQTIQSLLADHGLRELERLGFIARLRDLRIALEPLAPRLGDPGDWQQLQQAWAARWARATATIQEGMAWPMAALARRLEVRDRGMIEQLAGGVRSLLLNSATVRTPTTAAPESGASANSSESGGGDTVGGGVDGRGGAERLAPLVNSLWDEWAEDLLREFVDGVEIDARKRELSPAALRSTFEQVTATVGGALSRSATARLSAALARPGSVWQRWARRCTGFLMTFLPALALFWIGHRIVVGFHDAATSGAYLNSSFAVHSLLLLGLAWAGPFTLDRLLRPSIERCANDALRGAYADGLAALGQSLRAAGENAEAQARRLRCDLLEIIRHISIAETTQAPPLGGTVGRVVANVPAGDAPIPERQQA